METQNLNKTNRLNNTTRKKKILVNSIPNLNNEPKEILCKKYPSTFKGFEEKIDELFKQKNIDITSTTFNLEKEIINELKKAVSPSNITPNNDFYSYINERWLEDLDIEAYQQYITQVDDFRLVQDKVYRELISVINEYINNPQNEHTRKGKCIKNAYESFKTFNSNAQTRCLSQVVVEYIDEIRKNKQNIWLKLAVSNKNEIMSWAVPFVWSINPNEKNPKKYMCYLEPPQLTLLDNNIYYDYDDDSEEDKIYKKKYRKRYLKYLNDIFTVAFGENHGYNVKDVYDTEVELLNAINCELIKESDMDADGYNLISKDEALKNFSFNWTEFCKGLGFTKIPEEFVTSNVNYLLCGTKLLLEKWDSEQWRTYWIFIYIRQQTRWDEYGYKVFYDFQGNFLRGQESEVDDYLRPFFGMSFTFNTFLTKEYISRYKNEQAVEYVKTMVNDLKRVFIRIIKRNDWLEKKTKAIAIEKLESIRLIVGSPGSLREDPLLNYKPDDPWGNLVKMANWRHNQAINLVGKDIIDIPVIDWTEIPPKLVSTQAYVVNAMYTPTENSIYIPLGYIQKPFVDLDERGLEYNLAHIGFTVCHEMSHALDDWGSKYDAEGKLNNWWTKKDAEEFSKIQENIVKQYETYALYDGIKFDAWPSIGEDLADISGFAICLEYLRDFQLKNQDILPIQDLSFKAFFTYFAVQSRQKISKKAILAQLKTNPHPLDKYRCNIPLSRSNVFRAIYNVKKGDKMWWNSTNTVW
jgi:predicted metalloendopeptidase